MRRFVAKVTCALAAGVLAALNVLMISQPAFATPDLGNCSTTTTTDTGFTLIGDCTTPSTAPSTPVTASPPVCTDASGAVLPCSTTELGRWNGTCYNRPLIPQPPPEDPIWAGRIGGTIVECAIPGGATTLEFMPTILIDLPNAEDIARRAVASMHLPAAEINLTP